MLAVRVAWNYSEKCRNCECWPAAVTVPLDGCFQCSIRLVLCRRQQWEFCRWVLATIWPERSAGVG